MTTESGHTHESGHTQNAGVVPPGGWPPPNVTAEANRLQLGSYLGGRRLSQHREVVRLIIDLAAIVGMIILVVVLAMINENIGVEERIEGQITGSGPSALLRAIGLGACLGAVAGIGDTIRTLLALGRSETFYLYQGGLVQRTGGAVTGVAFSELSQVRPVPSPGPGGAERPESYVLVPNEGASTYLPVDAKRGGDPFADQMLALVHQHNVPISQPQ